MKVIKPYGRNAKAVSISTALDSFLSASYHSEGMAEEAVRVAKTISTAHSNLIQLLHEKGVLTDEEVMDMLPSYEKVP